MAFREVSNNWTLRGSTGLMIGLAGAGFIFELSEGPGFAFTIFF
jgi:hypothetical protein